MTLAELQAICAVLRPEEAARLSPVFALVPWYATHTGRTVESVWSAPVDIVGGIVEALPDLFTDAKRAEAGPALEAIQREMDPEAMRQRMLRRAVGA